MKPPNSPRTASSNDTRTIGNLDGAKPGDVGFHFQGDQFNGSRLYPNLVPGDGNLNITAYATLEGLWKKSALVGKPVPVVEKLTYVMQRTSIRQTGLDISFEINGKKFQF